MGRDDEVAEVARQKLASVELLLKILEEECRKSGLVFNGLQPHYWSDIEPSVLFTLLVEGRFFVGRIDRSTLCSVIEGSRRLVRIAKEELAELEEHYIDDDPPKAYVPFEFLGVPS